MLSQTHHRLAARAVIIHEGRILLVNAYPDHHLGLWCAPGGGVEKHASLPENLEREVFEETGLTVEVGAPVLINEFHDPEKGYHQVDLFFSCAVVDADLPDDWHDPEKVVTKRAFFSEAEARKLLIKPDRLLDVAFGDPTRCVYDPLETILR